MTEPGQSTGLYRPDIDGLRAIAILSVVLYHAGVPAVSGGFTGVDIFFVISGYLIGGHIYGELQAGSFSFPRFYQRRARRILPAFYAVLIFTLLAGLLLLSAHELHFLAASAFAATLSVSNLFFLRYLESYFRAKTTLHPMLMTWSLGVEVQFLLLIPLLMVLLARIRRSLILPATVCICIFSFLFAWRQVEADPASAFYLLPSRAWELGMGVSLAVAQQSRKPLFIPNLWANLLGLVGVILVVAPVFMLKSSTPFPGPAALPAVMGAALLIALPSSWIGRKMLSQPPLVFLGRISYSWYLWHWPLFSYLHIASDDKVPPIAAVLAVASSLALAILSYFLIERSFRQTVRSSGRSLIRFGAVTSVSITLCASIWMAQRIPQLPDRFPKLDKIETEARLSQTILCLPPDHGLNLSLPCFDASDSRPAVAIWGDSHAIAMGVGLRSIANAQNYGFIQMNLPGCLPLTGATSYGLPFRDSGPRCMQFNGRALRFLQADQRIRVVILAGQWTNFFRPDGWEAWLLSDSLPKPEKFSMEAASPLFQSSLRASIQSLQAAGKQVIVVEDVPTFDFDPISRYLSSHIPARRLLAGWMGSPDATDPGSSPAEDRIFVGSINAQMKTAIDGLSGVSLINLHSVLCSNGVDCPYRIGDHLLYWDGHHLTRSGDELAFRELRFAALESEPNLMR
jgi:peptidoglycan/LPS O-acetylase OafA/YrhL